VEDLKSLVPDQPSVDADSADSREVLVLFAGPTSSFDYTPYADDDGVADELRAAAEHIRERGKVQNATISDIGSALLRVKDKVGHGSWGLWLDAEFGMSESTAERYMNVSARLGDKFVTVTKLQPTTLYKLASRTTPLAVIEQIVARAEAGNCLSNSEANDLLETARQDASRAAKEAKLTSGQRAARTGQQTKTKHKEEKRDREAADRNAAKAAAAAAAVAMLDACMGDRAGEFVELLKQTDMYRVEVILKERSIIVSETDQANRILVGETADVTGTARSGTNTVLQLTYASGPPLAAVDAGASITA